MPQSPNRTGGTKEQHFKLIYNPNAGKKRRLFSLKSEPLSLDRIKFYFDKYQIATDFIPTRSPGHATELARLAIKEGYKGVIAAGGDGTIGEAANGLVGTELPLGIIPLGSFMNVARMLSIPADIEKAVQLIKIGRMRKIDVGMVSVIGGKRLTESLSGNNNFLPETAGQPESKPKNVPYLFLESAGVGLQAQLHFHMNKLEKGDIGEIFRIIKTVFDFYGFKIQLGIDNYTLNTRVMAIDISNGAFSGASLRLAPEARLNDHKLTVKIYRLGKFTFLHTLFKLFIGQKFPKSKIETRQGKKIRVESSKKYLVHVDGRMYGLTDAEFEVLPNALTVITGFPDPREPFLEKRTYLDP